MVVGDTFNVIFDSNYYSKGEILFTNNVVVTVIKEPRRKWYHLLLQFISLGWFKANWYYELKVIQD